MLKVFDIWYDDTSRLDKSLLIFYLFPVFPILFTIGGGGYTIKVLDQLDRVAFMRYSNPIQTTRSEVSGELWSGDFYFYLRTEKIFF